MAYKLYKVFHWFNRQSFWKARFIWIAEMQRNTSWSDFGKHFFWIFSSTFGSDHPRNMHQRQRWIRLRSVLDLRPVRHSLIRLYIEKQMFDYLPLNSVIPFFSLLFPSWIHSLKFWKYLFYSFGLAIMASCQWTVFFPSKFYLPGSFHWVLSSFNGSTGVTWFYVTVCVLTIYWIWSNITCDGGPPDERSFFLEHDR